MSLTMENPLTPSLQQQLSRTVQDLQSCIVDLCKEFEDSCCAITDDSQVLHRFCAKLEFLLQAGFKSRTSLLGGRKEYWNYMCDCLAGNKGLNDGIRFVKTINELKTNLGRGRALIRFCLMHKRLADTVQQCGYNNKATQDWYDSQAVWHNPFMVSGLVGSLYDLNDLQFDLSPRGYDLDASWPTFARKQFGGSVQGWAPPSRSTSISSLASTPNLLTQQSFADQLNVSMESEAGLDKLRAEMSETENEKLHLQVRVDSLLEERTQSSKKKEAMESQVENLQRQNGSLQVQVGRLETELKIKEEAFAEKEQVWTDRQDESNKMMNELMENIQTLKSEKQQATDEAKGVREDSEKFVKAETLECKMKLAASEKTISTVRIELKAATMQLQSTEKVSQAKGKLIELLDRKLTAAENKNTDLLQRFEEAVLKKERGESDPNNADPEAVKKLEGQLADSVKANDDLKRINSELRTMLSELETKSVNLGALAKEKVLKYVDENKQLKENIEQLTQSLKDYEIGEKTPSGGSADVKELDGMTEGQGRIAQLEQQIAQLNKEKECLAGDLHSARDKLDEQSKELVAFQSKLQDFRQDMAEATPGLEQQGPATNPIQQMKQLQTRLSESGNEADDTNKDVTDDVNTGAPTTNVDGDVTDGAGNTGATGHHDPKTMSLLQEYEDREIEMKSQNFKLSETIKLQEHQITLLKMKLEMLEKGLREMEMRMEGQGQEVEPEAEVKE